MAGILHNYSLENLNSFGLNVRAQQFVSLDSATEVIQFLENYEPGGQPRLILGEGSNILFMQDFEGLVIHPAIRGIEVVTEDELSVELKTGAGENWDHFVEYTVNQGLSGLENLSLIPGQVGSAPVQNIGAYGVEVKERINWVEGINLDNGEEKRIYRDDCGFGYRSSIFKKQLKDRFLITHVSFSLDKNPRFELGYGILEQEFHKQKVQDLQSLRDTVIAIRSSKLPDPSVIGNAGSFFKNPVMDIKSFGDLLDRYPDIPSYPAGEMIKVPAAWLIEKAGWKGVREGDTGTWPKQPLVIVNYGKATGKEIFRFSEQIRESVSKMFGIGLEREVNII
jgi:UDP-N-acetylmuramate dehydrogenase